MNRRELLSSIAVVPTVGLGITYFNKTQHQGPGVEVVFSKNPTAEDHPKVYDINTGEDYSTRCNTVEFSADKKGYYAKLYKRNETGNFYMQKDSSGEMIRFPDGHAHLADEILPVVSVRMV